MKNKRNTLETVEVKFNIIDKYIDVSIDGITYLKRNVMTATSALCDQKDLGRITQGMLNSALDQLYRIDETAVYFGSQKEIKTHSILCALMKKSQKMYPEDPKTRPVFEKCYDTSSYRIIGNDMVSKKCYSADELSFELDMALSKNDISETTFFNLDNQISLLDFSKAKRINHVDIIEKELTLN